MERETLPQGPHHFKIIDKLLVVVVEGLIVLALARKSGPALNLVNHGVEVVA